MTDALDAAAHRMLAALGAAWPDAHPGTGEPFVSALDVRSIAARVPLQRMVPQSRPTRTIVEYDEDGCEVSRRERTTPNWPRQLPRGRSGGETAGCLPSRVRRRA